MERISLIILIIYTFCFKSIAQSTTITPEQGISGQYTNQKISIQTEPNTYGFEHTNGTISIATFVSNNAAWLMTTSNHPLFFSTSNQNQTPGLALLTNGNVGIGTSAPTEKLHVVGGARISSLGGNGTKFIRVNNIGLLSSTPQTSYFNIPRASFLPVNGNVLGFNADNGGIYCIGNTVGYLEAPINLPDGALISNLATYYSDNGSKNLRVQLHRRNYTSSTSTIVSTFSSTGASGNMDILNGDVNINAYNVVDNNTYLYYIRVAAIAIVNNNEVATTWGDGTTLTINQIKVTYSY